MFKKKKNQEYKLDYSHVFTKRISCFAFLYSQQKKQKFERLLVMLIKSKIKTMFFPFIFISVLLEKIPCQHPYLWHAHVTLEKLREEGNHVMEVKATNPFSLCKPGELLHMNL